MQKYGNNRSEKNVKPERDKDDILKKQNMQVGKAPTSDCSDF